jgi:hypothetical protein
MAEPDPIQVGDILPEVLVKARMAGEALARQRAGTEPGKRKRGRPKGSTRLHPGLILEVAALVRDKRTLESACVSSGIPMATYRKWKGRGMDALMVFDATGEIPEGEGIFVDFVLALERARAEAHAEVAGVANRLMLGGEVASITRDYGEDGQVVSETITFTRPDRQMVAWWLERSFPADYQRRVELSGPDGGPIPVEVEVSARETLKRKMGEVAGRIGPAPEAESA